MVSHLAHNQELWGIQAPLPQPRIVVDIRVYVDNQGEK